MFLNKRQLSLFSFILILKMLLGVSLSAKAYYFGGERKKTRREIQVELLREYGKMQRNRAEHLSEVGEEIRLLKNGEYSGDLTQEDINRKLKSLAEEKADLTKEINEYARLKELALKKSGWGDVIMNGIVGRNSKVLEDIVVGNDGLAGLGYGVLHKGAEAVGDNIGDGINTVVRSGFKWGLGWLYDFLSYFKRSIFNRGRLPFDKQEIKAWKDMIHKGAVRLERALKDSAKYESRSKDMLARKIDRKGETDGDISDDQKKISSVWRLVAVECANDCNFLVAAVDSRKEYYKKDKDQFVIHIAQQLQNSLNGMRDLLLRAETLKEFASLLEVKSGFPLLVKRLGDLFDVLSNNLNLRSFSLDKRKTETSTIGTGYKKKKNYSWGDDDYDDDYPHSYI